MEKCETGVRSEGKEESKTPTARPCSRHIPLLRPAEPPRVALLARQRPDIALRSVYECFGVKNPQTSGTEVNAGKNTAGF